MEALDTTKLTSLERICYGNNKINALSIEAIKKVLPQLKSYVGKKIKLATNDKAKSFKIELLEVPYNKLDGARYRTYLKFECNSLCLFNDVTVKDRSYEGGGHGVSYYKKELFLGDLDNNGILLNVMSVETTIKNYKLDKVFNAKEVEATKNKINQLEEEARNLKYSLPNEIR